MSVVMSFVGLFWTLLFFGPLIVWLLFRKRGGYKRRLLDAPPPGMGWELTEERSVDPITGELIAVWFERQTGERAYVRAGFPPGERR